jgi:hypothetical protein
LGIIPVIFAPVAFHVASHLSAKEIEMPDPSKVERNTTNTKEKKTSHQGLVGKVILSTDFPTSTNLLKPHDPPLRHVAITGINRAALSFLIPALPSLFSLSSSPLADLVLAFLAARLGNRRGRSEANAVDAFTIIAQSSVDVVSGDLGVLPGRVGEFGGVLAAVW